MSIYHKYYLDNNVIIDVFGYDHESEKYDYIVQQGCYYKMRQAKQQYKYPDKRNEWHFPYGLYINVILPDGKKHRLFLN